MRTMRNWIGTAALAGCCVLTVAAYAQSAPNTAAAPAPAATALVLDDQLVGQIKRGETTMDQVRHLITAKPKVNYQAGHEIWIYQGVAGAGSAQARTVTVQFDDHGVVRNVGKVDLQ
jgi:outer membrane protein assembly factor BamE (lipoprotein component of BamABCDE complex)